MNIYHNKNNGFIWVFTDKTGETRLHSGTYDKGARVYKSSVTLPKNSPKLYK